MTHIAFVSVIRGRLRHTLERGKLMARCMATLVAGSYKRQRSRKTPHVLSSSYDSFRYGTHSTAPISRRSWNSCTTNVRTTGCDRRHIALRTEGAASAAVSAAVLLLVLLWGLLWVLLRILLRVLSRVLLLVLLRGLLRDLMRVLLRVLLRCSAAGSVAGSAAGPAAVSVAGSAAGLCTCRKMLPLCG
jgi:hypothetical protein